MRATNNTVAQVAPTAARLADPPPAAREDGRLPPLAVPERYAVDLVVDPDQPRFRGEVKVLLQVPAPTRYLVLHGRDLHVSAVRASAGAEQLSGTASARAAHGGEVAEELVLAFDRELPQGVATLTIVYDAPFSPTLGGLYRVKDGDAWYAFTQFESTDARRALPCFDEPAFKVPWDVTLRVPSGMVAVSNGREIQQRTDGPLTSFTFATTPPLPSYLVAFAVGPFDVRPGPSLPVPIRLIATKGKGALGSLAIDATAALTQELTRYFGIAYPYDKLDIVAVPDFDAGAMENAGLITFRDDLLLMDPTRASFGSRRSQIKTIAHEVAHQWFGDLVTMRWWDDLWLNEGFATWAEAKVTDRWRPSFGARLEQTAAIGEVMDTDAMRSARAVRQPVSSTSEAMEAFDGITYDKGAAVLAMVERWVGDARFQQGVHAYLTDHAWGNAKALDLLGALGVASGKDVASMAATYLDSPGVPNVVVTSSCSPTGAGQRLTVAASQAPWRPGGYDVAGLPGHPQAPAAAAPRWTIPVELGSPTQPLELDLSAATPEASVARDGCPDWLNPNPGASGYYRYSLDEKGWDGLFKAWPLLDTGSRLGALQSLWAQVRSGWLPPRVVLRFLPVLDQETSRFVVGEEVDVLAALSDGLVEEQARPAFRRYVAERMLPHRRRAESALAARHEDEDATLLLRSVVWALGQLADDEATLTDAARVAGLWLDDPSRVDPDTAESRVGLGMRRAKVERIAALRAAAKSARTPQDRTIALRALGGFGDRDVLARALDVSLEGEARTQDVFTILWSAASRRQGLPVVVDWLGSHWEKVHAKLPDALSGGLFGLAGMACTRADRDRMSAFFGPRSKLVEGTARPLAEALEKASLCIALRERGSAGVTAALLGQKP